MYNLFIFPLLGFVFFLSGAYGCTYREHYQEREELLSREYKEFCSTLSRVEDVGPAVLFVKKLIAELEHLNSRVERGEYAFTAQVCERQRDILNILERGQGVGGISSRAATEAELEIAGGFLLKNIVWYQKATNRILEHNIKKFPEREQNQIEFIQDLCSKMQMYSTEYRAVHGTVRTDRVVDSEEYVVRDEDVSCPLKIIKVLQKWRTKESQDRTRKIIRDFSFYENDVLTSYSEDSKFWLFYKALDQNIQEKDLIKYLNTIACKNIDQKFSPEEKEKRNIIEGRESSEKKAMYEDFRRKLEEFRQRFIIQKFLEIIEEERKDRDQITEEMNTKFQQMIIDFQETLIASSKGMLEWAETVVSKIRSGQTDRAYQEKSRDINRKIEDTSGFSSLKNQSAHAEDSDKQVKQLIDWLETKYNQQLRNKAQDLGVRFASLFTGPLKQNVFINTVINEIKQEAKNLVIKGLLNPAEETLVRVFFEGNTFQLDLHGKALVLAWLATQDTKDTQKKDDSIASWLRLSIVDGMITYKIASGQNEAAEIARIYDGIQALSNNTAGVKEYLGSTSCGSGIKLRLVRFLYLYCLDLEEFKNKDEIYNGLVFKRRQYMEGFLKFLVKKIEEGIESPPDRKCWERLGITRSELLERIKVYTFDDLVKSIKNLTLEEVRTNKLHEIQDWSYHVEIRDCFRDGQFLPVS